MTPTRRMWNFYADVRKSIYLATFLSSLTFISAIALMASSGWLIARASQMPPVLELSIAVVGVRTFALSRGVSRYAERLISHDATFKALSKIRSALYLKLENLAPSGSSAFRNGDLMSRLVSDVDEIQNLPLRVFIPVISGSIAAIFAIVVSFLILPIAGLGLLLTIGIVALVGPLLTSRIAAKSEMETGNIRGELSDELSAFFTGITDLLMLDAAANSLNRIRAFDDELTSRSQKLALSTGIANALTTFAQGVAILISVASGVIAVDSNQLNPVMLIVVALLPMAAFEAVSSFPTAALSFARVKGVAIRICEVLDAQPPIPESELFTATTSSEVSFHAVSAHWPNEQRPAVSGINLETCAGTKLGLVGASGCGKSSAAAVLAKFLLPSSGRYLLGKTNTLDMNGSQVRSVVTLSLQDSHIFATSILENLRISWPDHVNPPQEDLIWQALDDALLSDWVRSLPSGLDSILGERGANMSGGQRQRLMAARMFLANPQVWVLDEPTEHLNADLADQLMANFCEATNGAALVIATHRILDTTGLTQIVVLQQGITQEVGSPAELIAAEGIYYQAHKIETQAIEKLSESKPAYGI